MKIKNSIARTLECAKNKAQYDAYAKKLLSNKQVLAWILKSVTEEFQQYDIDTIVGCIEQEPIIGSKPVFTSEIVGNSNESNIPGEGKITYDIIFDVFTPHSQKVKLIINVEAQKKWNPGYILINRSILYAARMLSEQLDKEFTTDNYDDIKKVYSIWICFNTPDYASNTITSYKMKQEDIYGTYDSKEKFDLLEVVFIRMKKDKDSQNDLIRMLNTLFNRDVKCEEKEEILNNQYGISLTDEVRKDVLGMCNLSEGIYEDGMEKGMEKGREEGIFVSIYHLYKDDDITIEKACEKLSMTEDEFFQTAKKYGLE